MPARGTSRPGAKRRSSTSRAPTNNKLNGQSHSLSKNGSSPNRWMPSATQDGSTGGTITWLAGTPSYVKP